MRLILLVAALVCFALATVGVSAKVNLTNLGLTCLVGSMLV